MRGHLERPVRVTLHRLAMLRRLRADRGAARQVLEQLIASGDAKPTWRVMRVVSPRWSPRGVGVAFAGPRDGAAAVVIKLPQTPEGRASLRRQQIVLEQLGSDSRLAGWIPRPPAALGIRRVGNAECALEGALPGISAIDWGRNPDKQQEVLGRAATAIGALHHLSAAERLIDDAMVARWVDDPIETLRGAVGGTADRGAEAALVRLRARLFTSLHGQAAHVSWIHGDYWLGNVLIGADGAVSGIIDWDRAARDELPAHDALHLLLYSTRHLASANALDVVQLATGGRAWAATEVQVLASARGHLPDDQIPWPDLVLLYWLRFSSRTIGLYPFLARDRAFVEREIRPMLAAV
jgi:hypothetical protein